MGLIGLMALMALMALMLGRQSSAPPHPPSSATPG